MNATFTRRITAAFAGAFATAGIFTGIALAAPAPAIAAPTTAANCTTAMSPSRVGFSGPNPLTRAAQVDAISTGSAARGTAVSCLGH